LNPLRKGGVQGAGGCRRITGDKEFGKIRGNESGNSGKQKYSFGG
jgi:hypothetical protein